MIDFGLAALVALLAATPPSAPAEMEVRQRLVAHDDLDFTGPAGIAVLESRVRRAVRRVCSKAGDRSLIVKIDERRCMEKAGTVAAREVARAVAKAREAKCLP